MQRTTLAKWLAVAALACAGFFFASGSAQAQEGHTVQGTQSSDGASAETGDADGANSSNFTGGPAATATDDASSQQNGSNTADVSQSGSAQSGDPVAGSQVVGAVADDVTVQNQNSADDAFALSGDASLVNDANIELGPQADSEDGVAQASQIGDNAADVSQTATAATGDAVAGAQVTGIVGDGEHIVQNQNDAFEPFALSGDANADNFAGVFLGPFAESDFGSSQAGQVGDNDAVLTQSAVATTGDAPAGSQVTGIVGGSATVQNQNHSELSFSLTGFADALNQGNVVVGPQAEIVVEGTDAQASQIGDNAADVVQDVMADSGDALAGSQVTGAVGDQSGFLTVQNQQASEGDFAFSGGAIGVNDAVVDAGPIASAFFGTDAMSSQNGDNDVAVAQAAEVASGDALAGAQVTGAVGHGDVMVQNQNTADEPLALSGFAFAENEAVALTGPFAEGFDDAQASQVGDNAVDVAQALVGSTGDAVAGGQITGVVAADDVTVQNQNTVTDSLAITGDLVGFANFALVTGGPAANGGLSAQAAQVGDNAFAVAQAADLSTGDAVSGAQVAGVVAGGDVEVQQQNVCDGCTAITGDIDLANGGNVVELFGGPSAFISDPLSAGAAQATQTGDNVAAVDQVLAAATGDAVAGSQVTGVVADDEVVVQNQNTADGAFALSGSVTGAENFLNAELGPQAAAFDGTASASQIGDDVLVFAQDLEISSGDAVAGSQVTGVVGAEDADIQVANTDDASFALTGDTDGANVAAGVIGPDAFSDGEANTQQSGDTEIAGTQDLASVGGDAVAGAQVTGIVGDAGTAAAAAGVGDGAFAVAEAAA